MLGTALHWAPFRRSWSTGEDSPLNRAECGEGEDREQQGPLTASLASVRMWGWGGEVPGSRRTVNKEEGGIGGRKATKGKSQEAGTRAPGGQKKAVCSRQRGETQGRGQGWSDEQVSLVEGRAPPPEGDGSLGEPYKGARLHQVHVLESSLWLQWEDWTVGVEWSKMPSVETFALTRTIKKEGLD